MSNLKDIAEPEKVTDTALTFREAVQSLSRETPVAICGLGPGCRDTPEGWPIWACAWGEMAPYAELLFDPHTEEWWMTYQQSAERLNDYGVPVYLREEHVHVPLSRRLPREEIYEKLGERPQSTIGFMISHAIMENRDFGLFGVHMRSEEDEYRYQRANCRYLIGLARGLGLKVFVPPDSGLHDGRSEYGYDWLDAEPELRATDKAAQFVLDA